MLKSLSDFLGPDALNYLDYAEKDWGLEPYSEGSPVCSVGPGAMAYFARGLRLPFQRYGDEQKGQTTLFCNKIKNLPVNNNHSVPSTYHLHSVKGSKTGLWTLDDVRMTFHMQLYMHVVQP